MLLPFESLYRSRYVLMQRCTFFKPWISCFTNYTAQTLLGTRLEICRKTPVLRLVRCSDCYFERSSALCATPPIRWQPLTMQGSVDQHCKP